MKNKIKKLKLPLSKMTGEEKDYTAVLLEDVNSNMKAFWEVLSGTQNDVKELKTEFADLKDAVADNSIEIAELKIETTKITTRLDSIEDKQEKTNIRLDSIEDKQEKTNIRLDSIEDKQEKTNIRLDSIEDKFDDLIKEVSSIKAEMKLLKTSISVLTKDDKEKFEMLEGRIIRIEKRLELSTVDIS